MTLNKKWIISLLFAALVLTLAACGNDDESAEDNNDEAEEAAPGTEQPEMPEPDLEGIPEVVAEVNGEEITREEFETTYQGQFQQASLQAMMSGQEIDQDQLKGQIAEGLVGQRLLIQEADNSGIEASEEEIDEILDQLVEQNGMESRDEFLAALEEQQGMSEEEVRSELELQVKVDQLIARESGDIEPTDEEMEELYEEFAAQQEEHAAGEDGEETDVPSFEEMKPDLEAQVKRQKEAEASQLLVEKLREDADVTIHI
ncbi:SurA N-terminal domain-containing protein [Virgibacillus sp. C22-A2]|uniref:peptidylprolyl isomerase n=1 Tax=Virgibacillus tibetensis TaxID=3042313 RepID=A0ABU6KGF4_9BACI|nr:SurA N-terminal domain-containing protein [Virgibacillus sp. C22-A2]